MNDYELMRISENFDEAVDLGQYSAQQIEEMARGKQKKQFKQNYFDFYDDVKSHTLQNKQDW